MQASQTTDRPSAAVRIKHWLQGYREVGLSIILALQVTAMFVVSPLSGVGLIGPDASEVLRFGLAATAILVVNRNRIVGVCVGLTFLISVLCTIFLSNGVSGHAILLANIGVTIAFDLAVALTVAHAAFGAGRITVHRIMGAVILYLYIGLTFAGLFRLGAILLHPSFTGLSTTRRENLSALLYFSMSALTTSGFGDIVPLHPFMRSLANLEAVIGQLYPATLLARLVTLHGSVTESGLKRARKKDQDPA
jgi:hypothetical protein